MSKSNFENMRMALKNAKSIVLETIKGTSDTSRLCITAIAIVLFLTEEVKE